MKKIKRAVTLQDTAELLHMVEFFVHQAHEAMGCIVVGSKAATPEPIYTKARLMSEQLGRVIEIIGMDTYDVALAAKE